MIKLYYHIGSANHGCEAIVRSTKKILDCPMILYSQNGAEDFKYGIDKLCKIVDDKENQITNKLTYYRAAVYTKLTRSDYMLVKNMHRQFFDNVQKDDIYLSIGGDNYCYGGTDKLGFYNRAIRKRGAKTVLWGCSVEPDLLNEKAICEDIAGYHLITARESLSYAALKKINPNTVLIPDPAFQLDYAEPSKSNSVPPDSVGINISPLISRYEAEQGMVMKNYLALIRYILSETAMNIVLIPHVASDVEALNKLLDPFVGSRRIKRVSDCGCMELKGVIKCCRFLVTARTHASIAAYSTCVPTIVVGYSVKADGIAKDIFGTADRYVLPTQAMQRETDLTDDFLWLIKNEQRIKQHLREFMPSYCRRALSAKEKIRLLENQK